MRPRILHRTWVLRHVWWFSWNGGNGYTHSQPAISTKPCQVTFIRLRKNRPTGIIPSRGLLLFSNEIILLSLSHLLQHKFCPQFLWTPLDRDPEGSLHLALFRRHLFNYANKNYWSLQRSLYMWQNAVPSESTATQTIKNSISNIRCFCPSWTQVSSHAINHSSNYNRFTHDVAFIHSIFLKQEDLEDEKQTLISQVNCIIEVKSMHTSDIWYWEVNLLWSHINDCTNNFIMDPLILILAS